MNSAGGITVVFDPNAFEAVVRAFLNTQSVAGQSDWNTKIAALTDTQVAALSRALFKNIVIITPP